MCNFLSQEDLAFAVLSSWQGELCLVFCLHSCGCDGTEEYSGHFFDR